MRRPSSAVSTRQSRRRLVAVLPAALFCGVLLSAESGVADSGTVKRGRSADGRAYRVDATGVRMTDYIAELEVTVDDLKRQLVAAEDELAAKSLKSSATSPSGSVQETNLASSPPRAATILPPAAQLHGQCERDSMTLRSEIQRLQTELASRTTTRSAPAQAVGAKCDYNSPENPLWEQVNRLQTALMAGPTKESFVESEKRSVELEQEVQNLRSELSEKVDSVKQSESTISDLQARIASAEAQAAKASTDAAAIPTRAALASPPTRARADLDPLQVRSAGEEFRAQLSRLQSLISERKNLLDASKNRKGVSVSIQPLVARSGSSLDSLRGEVSRLSTASDIEAIRAGLGDVERVLQEDVSVLKRLSNLR